MFIDNRINSFVSWQNKFINKNELLYTIICMNLRNILCEISDFILLYIALFLSSAKTAR